MTSLFTARRRAEEFAAAVDGDPGSATLDVGVAGLVGVVTALRAHQDTAPRPEFAGDLRSRLMAEADQVLTAENGRLALPVRARGSRERRMVAVASALVLIGGTAGMAAAARDALPGEPLYPIKRGIERAEAGLSLSPAGKGHDLLNQATDRLNEVQGLLGEDSFRSTPQVPETLAEFSVQATQGADLLLESFQETRDPSSVVQVRVFAADGIKLLEALAGDVPPEGQDELAAAAVTLRDIDARANAACSTCTTDMPDLQVPGLILARNEVDRALDKVGSAGLDNSHPVVVPRGTVRTKPDAGAAGGLPGGASTRPPVKTPGSGPTAGAPEAPSTGGVNPGDAVSEAPTDIADGLSGVVETLLPDPDPNTLLP